MFSFKRLSGIVEVIHITTLDTGADIHKVDVIRNNLATEVDIQIPVEVIHSNSTVGAEIENSVEVIHNLQATGVEPQSPVEVIHRISTAEAEI